MANRSAEARGADLWRNGANPPRPPAHLTRPAKILWRQIISERPSDWFTPSTARLLLRYVRTCIHAEKLADALDLLPIGSPEAERLLKQVLLANTSLGTLAAKMRLTQQVAITARSTGRMSERGSAAHELLGGAAVRQLHGRQRL
jgi:hypothetical protein